MHKRLLIPGLMLAFSVPGILTAASAQAATVTALPITSFYQIVADTSHGHLFISQGSSSENEILVTNLAGQPVESIAGQDGVMGMALSPDGSTLFAALASDHAVTAISTTTLQQTASYPLGDANTPQDVAVQSGKVWVSYDTGSVGNAAIGDINLPATTPGFQTQAAMGGWYSAPELAADPSDTGILVAAEPGESPGSAASYNVSADPASAMAGQAPLQDCENERDLAVVPGGSEFILACGAPYAEFRFSSADLSQQGSYASTYYPNSVAISPRSGLVAAGDSGDTTKPDLNIYNEGGDIPLNTFALYKSGSSPAPRGLAWASDGSELFVILENGGTGYSLDTIDGPTLDQPTLTLTGPGSAPLNTPVTLTGRLTQQSGTPAAGASVTVTRSASDGTTQTFPATTAADGTYTLTDTPPAAGTYRYTASYAGSRTSAQGTASTTVTVTRIPTTLTLTTKSTTFTYKPTVQVTAHLGATDGNRRVSIYADPFGRTTRTLLKTGTVNSSGNLTVSYAAAHSTAFSVVFSGDASYMATTAAHDIYVKARVSESLTGYYSHTRIRRTTYWRFHRRRLLHAHATVAPGKSGECVKFQAQEYYRGAWHASVATPCLHLNSASRRSVPFTLTHADIGYHYRIRAEYVRASTDTSNRSNDSAWRYFQVEK